jgi:hypothetical protein
MEVESHGSTAKWSLWLLENTLLQDTCAIKFFLRVRKDKHTANTASGTLPCACPSSPRDITEMRILLMATKFGPFGPALQSKLGPSVSY